MFHGIHDTARNLAPPHSLLAIVEALRRRADSRILAAPRSRAVGGAACE
jgi:hypothetical protein